MIQIDVFFSFAMGASFATLAGDKLKRAESIFVNPYFVFNVIYMGAIFSPCGVYVMWQHVGWETMFFYSTDDLHGLVICLFSSTNVLLGILGFYVCARLVKTDHVGLAHTVWTTAYAIMFAIASLGYSRSFYAGTIHEWRNGVKYSLFDFFGSEVFYTLLFVALFSLPTLYYPMITWPAGPEVDANRKKELLRTVLFTFARSVGLMFGVLLLLFLTGRLPFDWKVDRLIAFLLGEVVFGLPIFSPLFFVPSAPTRTSASTKSVTFKETSTSTATMTASNGHHEKAKVN